MQEFDLLILGAGWTSTFLLPLAVSRSITTAATTTTGRDGTIKFKFDPEETDPSYFAALPTARTVLITFPLKGTGQSKLLTESYKATHRGSSRFIQLGSTGIWQTPDQKDLWVTRHSKYNKTNERAVAEDELLGLGGCVLNLSGLWGGPRDPKHWVDRVADTKEKVKDKTSLHMIHGEDVARAILAVHKDWEMQVDKSPAKGQRWMLTDGFVYDWWSLFAGWSQTSAKGGQEENKGEAAQSRQSIWVQELMWEQDVKALPRSMEALGRCYDSREFWHVFGIAPARARI